jgi:D-hydroxyproline dehydrogenase
MSRVLVIGAGVVGLCTALRLAEQGLQVSVADQAPARGAASWGNIGHIASEQCAPLASWHTLRSIPRRLFSLGGPVGLPLSAMGAWLPFGLHMMRRSSAAQFQSGVAALGMLLRDALPAWERLAARWPEQQLLSSNGHFVAWESLASARAGRQFWSRAPKGTTLWREANSEELQALGQLAPRRQLQAIRFSNTGKITDLHALRQALTADLAAKNVQIIAADVTRLSTHLSTTKKTHARQAVAHTQDGHTIAADQIVVCGGVRSGQLMEQLGHTVPLIAERGYHLEYASTQHSPQTLPVVFEDRSVVVNAFGHGLRIAGFVEFAQPDTPPDARKWARLEQHMKDLGIATDANTQATATRWMGARPTLPDYLPAIGRSHLAHNVFYAFGHQHLGLTLAPVTAEWMARLVTHRDLEPLLRPFSISRFKRL